MPWPPYAYVPGHRPHPHRHPRGHSFGVSPPACAPLRPAQWWRSERYLEGLALFERGYYWEAHEAWEALWIAAGRTGPTAELLRGLIKLAAAGLKVRQGRGRGAVALGTAAAACFERARRAHGGERMAGLAWAELQAFTEHVRREGETLPGSPDAVVEVVFERSLVPQRED